MLGDAHRLRTARALVAMRDHRGRLFPAGLFDEHSWDLLLLLFIAAAENRRTGEDELAAAANVCAEVARRWLLVLAKSGQIELRDQGDDVVLTPAATSGLRELLDLVGNGVAAR